MGGTIRCQRNPPYRIPGPAALPDVPLVDALLVSEGEALLHDLHQTMQSELAAFPAVRFSAAEFFVEETRTRPVNSRGFEAEQQETGRYVEWTLIAEPDGHRVERLGVLQRRRLTDMHLKETIRRQAGNVTDLLDAGAPSPYQGAVVLRVPTLGTFMNAMILKLLSSASVRHSGVSPWEVGEPVHSHQIKGDPPTLWADRRLPFGTGSNRFDEEGVPAGRHLLIENHRLAASLPIPSMQPI